jgi:hypothetical protein
MAKLKWEKINRDQKLSEALRKRPTRAQVVGHFPAKFPGWCRECQHEFGIGTAIRYNDEGQIVHGERCPLIGPLHS